jgi:hypothetical protein
LDLEDSVGIANLPIDDDATVAADELLPPGLLEDTVVVDGGSLVQPNDDALEMQSLQEEIMKLREEISKKDEEISKKDKETSEKDIVIANLELQVRHLRGKLATDESDGGKCFFAHCVFTTILIIEPFFQTKDRTYVPEDEEDDALRGGKCFFAHCVFTTIIIIDPFFQTKDCTYVPEDEEDDAHEDVVMAGLEPTVSSFWKEPSNATILKVSVAAAKEEAQCPVCRDVLYQAQFVRVCSHRFCLNCIKFAMSAKLQCPFCRAGVRSANSSTGADGELDQILQFLVGPIDRDEA